MIETKQNINYSRVTIQLVWSLEYSKFASFYVKRKNVVLPDFLYVFQQQLHVILSFKKQLLGVAAKE